MKRSGLGGPDICRDNGVKLQSDDTMDVKAVEKSSCADSRKRHLKLAADKFCHKPMAVFMHTFTLNACERAGVTLSGRVLDLGCNDGGFMDLLIAAVPPSGSASLVGLDYNYAPLRQAKKTPCNYRLLLNGDGRKLPFRDASFDLVIANMVMAGIPDTEAVTAELHRIVREKGRVVCTMRTGNFRKHYLFPRLLERLRMLGLAERYREHLDRRTGAVHIHRCATEWREYFSRSGFEIRGVYGLCPNRVVPFWDLLTLPVFYIFGLLRLRMTPGPVRKAVSTLLYGALEAVCKRHYDADEASEMSMVLIDMTKG